jgi:ribosome recycling factor
MKELEEKFEKSINILIEDLNKIHAGRASPSLIKSLVIIDTHGNKHHPMEIGLVRNVNSTTLAIKPWETGNIICIEKAVRASTLGINPIVIDQEVQLPFPALTQERRKELAKSINALATNTKNALRVIRHDFIKLNKKPTKEEEIKLEKDIQKIMDKFNIKIDESIEKKQKELMHI